MKRLAIFGSGGFAREVHQLVLDLNDRAPTWDFVGFVDDDEAKCGTGVHGYPVLGGSAWLAENPEVWCAIAIGTTQAKRRVALRLQSLGVTSFATLVHPRAWVGNGVQLGAGSIVCAGALVTTDIRIGNHVILNIGTTVGHDAVLADYVTAAPSFNISGNVNVGEGCDLGTGGAAIQGVAIGPWSIVGAGAVVTRSLPANVTAVGVPARVVKERAAGWHEGAGRSAQ